MRRSGTRDSLRSSANRARVPCVCSGKKGIPRRATVRSDPLPAGAGGYSSGSQSEEGNLGCCVAALIRQSFEHVKGFSEQGIFHGITD